MRAARGKNVRVAACDWGRRHPQVSLRRRAAGFLGSSRLRERSPSVNRDLWRFGDQRLKHDLTTPLRMAERAGNANPFKLTQHTKRCWTWIQDSIRTHTVSYPGRKTWARGTWISAMRTDRLHVSRKLWDQGQRSIVLVRCSKLETHPHKVFDLRLKTYTVHIFFSGWLPETWAIMWRRPCFDTHSTRSTGGRPEDDSGSTECLLLEPQVANPAVPLPTGKVSLREASGPPESRHGATYVVVQT